MSLSTPHVGAGESSRHFSFETQYNAVIHNAKKLSERTLKKTVSGQVIKVDRLLSRIYEQLKLQFHRVVA